MIKINFKKEMVMLPEERENGEKPTTLNSLLAFILAKSEDFMNPVKVWNWAMKVSKDGVLEIEKSDVQFLKDLIIKNKMLFASAKGQLIELIDSVKEE